MLRLPPTVVVPRFSAPFESTVRLPFVMTVPKVSGPASVIATLLPPTLTAPPKVFAGLVSVTLPVPAVMPVVPLTASAPVCVTSPLPLSAVRLPPTVVVPRFSAPFESTVRLPDVMTVPKVSGPASVIATLLPFAFTGPFKMLPGLVSVISAGTPPLLASSVVIPPTVNVVPPDCVIAPPFVVTSSAPLAVKLPKVVPPLGLFNVTLLPEIFTNDRLPAACVIVTLPPMASMPPVWANALVTVKLPAPSTSPPLWL